MPLSTADRQQPFFCSKSEARSVYWLSPPPKVRTERNLQNSRSSPDDNSSPVDLGCRIRAKCAFFTQLIRESWKPEDSLAERSQFELSGDFVIEDLESLRAHSFYFLPAYLERLFSSDGTGCVLGIEQCVCVTRIGAGDYEEGPKDKKTAD